MLGGTASGATVNSGGVFGVLSGVAIATVYDGGSGVLAGGTELGAIINSGGMEDVLSGGTATSATVNSGGLLAVSGGVAIATMYAGGSGRVLSGGVESGATINSGGLDDILSGGTAINTIVLTGGSLVVSSGGVADPAVISMGGSETISSGGTDGGAQISGGIQDVHGFASGVTIFTGSQVVESGGIATATTISGGTLVLTIGGAASGAITFAGATGILQIDSTSMPTNTISGLQPGDMFYLSGVAFDSNGSADLHAGIVLQITEGGQHYDLQLDPSQDFSGNFFQLNSATGGGTLVTEESTPCYCAGTLILTDRGEVEVERLAIGDNLITADGAVRPIRWIGRRSYAGRFAHGSHVLPICIKAGALDVDRPRRDLWISPHHAMFLDGALIEAVDLINGVSIIQAERVEHVDYIHIELDTHDVILAEGAFSESFVDDDSRGIFQNAQEFQALYPDVVTVRPARYCAPRIAFGTQAEASRRRIAQRAGIAYMPPSAVRGPRALVIDSRLPQIGHDGGANAILDHVRALQAAGFEVSFLALESTNGNAIALSSLGAALVSMPPSGFFGDFARAHAGRIRSCLSAPRRNRDALPEGGTPLF